MSTALDDLLDDLFFDEEENDDVTHSCCMKCYPDAKTSGQPVMLCGLVMHPEHWNPNPDGKECDLCVALLRFHKCK